MTDVKHKREQYTHAIQGLGATACAAALRSVAASPQSDTTLDHLRRLAILQSTSERAQTCLAIVAAADTENDMPMFESAGLQALSLLNRMADIAATGTTSAPGIRAAPTTNAFGH